MYTYLKNSNCSHSLQNKFLGVIWAAESKSDLNFDLQGPSIGNIEKWSFYKTCKTIASLEISLLNTISVKTWGV